jgi:hypothetical protein
MRPEFPTPMKLTLLSAVLWLTLAPSVFATSYAPISLPELVKTSAYILAGDIVNVRMTDKSGKDVFDPKARTGPGLENTIFLDVVIDQKLILKSRGGAAIPKELSIPLDTLRHMSLGQAQQFFKEKSFFFLDKEFRSAHPGEFMQPITEQRKLESILRRVSTP